jgi:hypothetical protein
MEHGDKLIVRDVDDFNAAEEALNAANPNHVVAGKARGASEISAYVGTHPYDNFMIVGHSAGADVGIMVADRMINEGHGGQLIGAILLAPAMSFQDGYGFSGDPKDMLENIRNSDTPTYTANGFGNGDVPNILTSLLSANYPNYFFDRGLASGLDHNPLAVDLTVLSTAWNFIFTYDPR